MLMRAIIRDDRASAPTLEEVQVECPSAEPGHLLVRVHAAGLNRAQLARPGGTGHAIHPLGIPGGELSGVVVEIGAGVEGFAVGDRVMALASGSYAQYAAFDHRLAVHVPPSIDLATAAGLPSWYMTAHNAVIAEGGLRAGETLLVQGATSGVGIAAAQIARCFGCANVIGIARSSDKLAKVAEFDHKLSATPGWQQRVKALTNDAGADLIVDLVGGGALSGNLEAAALTGRIVAVGRLGGSSDELDLNMLSRKRVRLIGVSFRTRTIGQRAAIARGFERDVLPAIVDGRIVPKADRSFMMREVREAQDYLRMQPNLGKVLLEIEQ